MNREICQVDRIVPFDDEREIDGCRVHFPEIERGLEFLLVEPRHELLVSCDRVGRVRVDDSSLAPVRVIGGRVVFGVAG